jgi:hypothetical protein
VEFNTCNALNAVAGAASRYNESHPALYLFTGRERVLPEEKAR